MRIAALSALAALSVVACSGTETANAEAVSIEDGPFAIEEQGAFDEPWAMDFYGDDSLLVTTKGGQMFRVEVGGTQRHEISGLPEVAYGGQGGLGDVVVHPDGEWVYFSYATEGDDGLYGAVVARGRLAMGGDGRTAMSDIETIWQQLPLMPRQGHYSHRIAFGPDGYLYIASGDRQAQDPAQDLTNNLGSVIRLNADGSVPEDNPMVDQGGLTQQVWSYGHRNILGMEFDRSGMLWEVEHGPAGGDELNLVERGQNYGWPIVSDGDNYDGREIPDHETRPEFTNYLITWTPVIAPGGMAFYHGDMFADWDGDLLIAGLASEALVRVEINRDAVTATEAARYTVSGRLREVETGPDGAIWVLEDGEEGRLLRLTPNS